MTLGEHDAAWVILHDLKGALAIVDAAVRNREATLAMLLSPGQPQGPWASQAIGAQEAHLVSLQEERSELQADVLRVENELSRIARRQQDEANERSLLAQGLEQWKYASARKMFACLHLTHMRRYRSLQLSIAARVHSYTRSRKRALARWRQADRLPSRMWRATARWRYRSCAAALASWQGRCARRQEVLRLLRSDIGRRLHPKRAAFRRWRTWSADVVDIGHAVVMWMNVTVAAAVRTWASWHTALRERTRLLRLGAARLMAPGRAQAFTSWRSRSLEQGRLRLMLQRWAAGRWEERCVGEVKEER